MGWDELLGALFNRLGLDFTAMSRGRMAVALTIYALVIVLLLGVGTLILRQADDEIAMTIIGAVVLLFGLAFLARVVINLSATLRKTTGTT